MYLCMYTLREVILKGNNFCKAAKFREFLFFANFSMKKKQLKTKFPKITPKVTSSEVVFLFLDIKKNLKLLEEFFKCVDLTF